MLRLQQTFTMTLQGLTETFNNLIEHSEITEYYIVTSFQKIVWKNYSKFISNVQLYIYWGGGGNNDDAC